MWFYGFKEIPLYELHRLKRVLTNAIWEKPIVPKGLPLSVHPLHFIYASTRASILGKKLGLRGQLAGLGLGSAALCYLTPIFSGSARMSSTNIFLHHNFDHTKDFVGSSIKGTIGASLAYLEMQRLGYAWTGHWEDCTSPSAIAKSPTSKKSKGSCAPKSNVPTPDFVFASSRDVCLVDAKGSSRSMKDVRSIAKNEWKRQIYSNRLAKLRAGGTATEGRIIATSLAHPHGIGLVTAYGRFPSAASSPGTLITTLPSATINAIKSVQQINFINAFYFLGLNAIAAHFVGGPVGQARAQLSWARHSAIDIDNRGAVFPGVRRVIDLGSQGAWSMQPFCRLDVLEEAFENLLSDNAPPVSEAHLILTPQIGESASSVDDKMNATDRMIVQSRDGVGAIFERVKNT